jgi:hypothetical protein
MGEGSAWGDFDDHGCPHTRQEKSAARRVISVARENSVGWRSYLDRQHSIVSRALAVCAAQCGRQCYVFTHLAPKEAETVTAGSRIAIALHDSAIVRLRHSAPVGHGFGVPSREQVLVAWEHTREVLAHHAPQITDDDGFVLPGFENMVSALAGRPVRMGTLIADTAEGVRALLATASSARA